MSDKELLKTIQNDIKNLDKCIEMCIDDEGIDYLKSIQKDLRKEEIKIVKKTAITKALKDKQKMKEYLIVVYNINTAEIIDTFIAESPNTDELKEFMDNELHNYNEPYYKLHYDITKV